MLIPMDALLSMLSTVRDGPYENDVDAWENDKELVFSMDMPGRDRDKISVICQDQMLSISSRSDCDNKKMMRPDIDRQFILPKNLDPAKADATYENGVLVVKIPRNKNSRTKIRIR